MCYLYHKPEFYLPFEQHTVTCLLVIRLTLFGQCFSVSGVLRWMNYCTDFIYLSHCLSSCPRPLPLDPSRSHPHLKGEVFYFFKISRRDAVSCTSIVKTWCVNVYQCLHNEQKLVLIFLLLMLLLLPLFKGIYYENLVKLPRVCDPTCDSL